MVLTGHHIRQMLHWLPIYCITCMIAVVAKIRFTRNQVYLSRQLTLQHDIGYIRAGRPLL